jgi:hypothetical protein
LVPAAVAGLAWSNHMFDFFKRLFGREPTVQTRTARAKPRKNRAIEQVMPAALPVPEVVEGNDHTDWDLWEDSVAVLDSQMQSLSPSARKIHPRKDAPSQFDDLDVFSRVGKNRDL